MVVVGSTAPAQVRSYFDRLLLAYARPGIVHSLGASERQLPQGSGSTMIMRRYTKLTADTTALTEGVTPPGRGLSITDITATLASHGAYIERTDIVDFVTEGDQVAQEYVTLLGVNAEEVNDLLLRDELLNTTNIQYAGAATTRQTVAATMVLKDAEMTEALATLRGSEARPLTSVLTAGAGVGSVPIGSSYIGLVHGDIRPAVEGMTGFIPVYKYSNYVPVHEDEIGWAYSTRWVMSNNCKVWASLGVGSIDVYDTIILAQFNNSDAGRSHAYIPLSSQGMQLIIKPVGSAGADDPLNQRGTMGWKRIATQKILNSTLVLRISHSLA